MIFMNFLPALLLYGGVTQISYFGTLCVLAMFIILAIGADDIFVCYIAFVIFLNGNITIFSLGILPINRCSWIRGNNIEQRHLMSQWIRE